MVNILRTRIPHFFDKNAVLWAESCNYVYGMPLGAIIYHEVYGKTYS